MFDDPDEERFRRAAKPTLEIFDWLETTVPPVFQPVLQEIRKRVFDPGYSVAELRENLRLSSDAFLARLARAMGAIPWQVIRECRLELAARLLRDTDMAVADIVLLVGYDSEPTFHRTFRAWSGRSPRDYRAHVRASTLTAAPEEIFTWDLWQKLIEGRVTEEEGAILIAALEELRCASSSSS